MGLDAPLPDLASHTLRGRRASSQDCALTRILSEGTNPLILMGGVADGVGSLPGGAKASSALLDQLATRIEENPGIIMRPGPLALLISNISRSIPSGLTTLAAVLVHGARVMVAAAGDSRVYRISSSDSVQISRDHTALQDARDRGLEFLEDPELEGGRIPAAWSHALTRVLGAGKSVAPEIHGPLEDENDLWVAVTDGVWGSLSEEEISGRCRSAASASDAVDTLLEDALISGSLDNVGAAVVAPGGWPFGDTRDPR